ncbi:hypothetical protein AMS68_000589 [Peltaster fructicola]|uniref:Beta-xylosidase C-terminal Concanavalin A-like domain-containing protein n=1 Tax=Peltaster fructicola TaxID=286661 RepID=A0A6H0XK21_9PEZI|nr:hypothetical protein AMS68_000589 [Peltaster fructicola]
MSYHWEALAQHQALVPSDLTKKFSITAPPGCDIWRPSSERNVFDAPAIITKIKASSFQSIEVTVSARWKTLYDQGGILLVFPGGLDIKPGDSRSWIKAGIENEQGTAKLGVVGTHKFSDWSLSPTLDDSGKTTIKFVRKGTVLWVYTVHDGKDIGLREVTWAFLEGRGDDAEIWVGVYAAKPTPDSDNADGKLVVNFEDLKLNTSS